MLDKLTLAASAHNLKIKKKILIFFCLSDLHTAHAGVKSFVSVSFVLFFVLLSTASAHTDSDFIFLPQWHLLWPNATAAERILSPKTSNLMLLTFVWVGESDWAEPGSLATTALRSGRWEWAVSIRFAMKSVVQPSRCTQQPYQRVIKSAIASWQVQ